MSQEPAVTGVVNDNAAVYYTGFYWNDLQCVRDRINERISGRADESWQSHLARRYGCFQRALSLNCGNGWVERELVERGIVSEAVGVDYSAELLAEACEKAISAHLPITYLQTDVNQATFPASGFDLVINHAAGHHIACLDQVFRHICSEAGQETLFVSFDYVGPHRNQYSYDAWRKASEVNSALPPALQQHMIYPSLATMIHDDPTEAIHSELIVETLHRYFDVTRAVPLGGAIAYPLLTHNRRLFEHSNEGERQKWSEYILSVDDDYLQANPESSLFAYLEARPAKQTLSDPERLATWSRAEKIREEEAALNRGYYYDLSPYQLACEELHLLRREVRELQAELASVRGKVENRPRSWSETQVRRLASRPSVRRIRGSKQIGLLESKIRERLSL